MKKFLLPSGDVLNFFNEYNDLYNFWTDALLENTNNNKMRLQKTNFLKDLRTDSMFTKIFRNQRMNLIIKLKVFIQNYWEIRAKPMMTCCI